MSCVRKGTRVDGALLLDQLVSLQRYAHSRLPASCYGDLEDGDDLTAESHIAGRVSSGRVSAFKESHVYEVSDRASGWATGQTQVHGVTSGEVEAYKEVQVFGVTGGKVYAFEDSQSTATGDSINRMGSWVQVNASDKVVVSNY